LDAALFPGDQGEKGVLHRGNNASQGTDAETLLMKPVSDSLDALFLAEPDMKAVTKDIEIKHLRYFG
jgi:hypothetical protein